MNKPMDRLVIALGSVGIITMAFLLCIILRFAWVSINTNVLDDPDPCSASSNSKDIVIQPIGENR